MKHDLNHNSWSYIHASLLIVVVATFGSLFFSEIMKLPPCVLCWYQRIAMYPLLPILVLGILMEDKKVANYSILLSITGLIASTYHNFLYYKIISDSLSPCAEGISCTSRQIEWFGFITIPLMSLVAFLTVTILFVLFKNRNVQTGELL